MLVLSRKKNESIIINGNIEVKIIETDDGKVRIGIEAPKEIEIHRKEIFELIKKENQASLNSKSRVANLKGRSISLNIKSDKNKPDKMLK